MAALMQGVVLGNFIQGVEVDGREFAGGALDWANGFAILTGIALVFGYALLGATWLIYKTDGETQDWARLAAKYVLSFVAIAMVVVSIAMPFVDPRIMDLWFSQPNIFYLLPVPVLTAITFVTLWLDLNNKAREIRPFLLSLALFLFGFIGFGISLYPWIVPFNFTLWEAAAAPTSQSFTLIGVAALLPVILGYTAYSYYVFRGKSSDEATY